MGSFRKGCRPKPEGTEDAVAPRQAGVPPFSAFCCCFWVFKEALQFRYGSLFLPYKDDRSDKIITEIVNEMFLNVLMFALPLAIASPLSGALDRDF